MKPIIVKDQVRLGPGRCLMLSISGMYYRVTRSAITVLILALAVAFLSYILFFGIVGQDTQYEAYQELRESRQLGEWVTRLSVPDQYSVVFQSILARGDVRLNEFKSWGRLSDEETAELKESCKRLQEFTAYFDDIPRSSRAVLIADSDPQEVVVTLADGKRRENFLNMLDELKLSIPMGSVEELEKLVTVDQKIFADAVARIQAGQRLALSRIHGELAGMTVTEALAAKSGPFVRRVRSEGFTVSDQQLELLSKQATVDLDVKKLAAFMDRADIKAVIARRVGIEQSELSITRVLPWAGSKGKARWLSETLEKYAGEGKTIAAEDILRMSSSHKRDAALQKAVGDEIPRERFGLLSLPTRTMWLILVSFLVCVIGISNTMLMSVTDRFAEIATMKCLGAMDTFIMVLYVFEAMFQGVAGSFVGVVLGFALAMLRGTMDFGNLVFEWIPMVDMLIIALLSFVTGIIIAAVAAMWPSWAAARLAPMEAMRVE